MDKGNDDAYDCDEDDGDKYNGTATRRCSEGCFDAGTCGWKDSGLSDTTTNILGVTDEYTTRRKVGGKINDSTIVL